VLLIMVSYKYLPVLGQMGEVEVVLYDEGESRLVDEMQASGEYEVRRVSSPQEFESYMDDADEGEMGLVVPAGYDTSLDGEEPAYLEAYVLWSSRLQADELEIEFETKLSELMGARVEIELGGVIMPGVDAMGNSRMIALIPLLTVIIVGMMTVPHLMHEESSTRTLDTLLVSPASVSHVVAGKFIAGAVYCLATGVITLAFIWMNVIHWGLCIATLLATTLFGVGLGLLLGSYISSQQQLSLWSMILFQPILIPVVFYAIEPVFPQAVRSALPWIPNVTLAKMFHLSNTSAGASGILAGQLLTLAGCILLLYALVIWKLRKSAE
jgi:ABC-type transport system involved in cytochrome c biogenesis permease component